MARDRRHIEAAGLSDLMEVREGDFLEMLNELGGEVDLVLIDSAYRCRCQRRSARPAQYCRRIQAARRPAVHVTHEICHRQCAAYYRLSPNGWTWGNPADLGRPIRLADGSYPAHAPTNQVMPDGSPLVIGQMLMTATDALAPDSGTILFASRSGDTAGPWVKIPAPVSVPMMQARPCANYSSALLPLDGGRRLLELAGRIDADGRCRLYAGRLGWPPSGSGRAG